MMESDIYIFFAGVIVGWFVTLLLFACFSASAAHR